MRQPLCQRATALLLAIFTAGARAQGGPPMVTDDPGTPGDGHWEINLGNIDSHAGNAWLIAMPDLDLNYGWGERIQLKMDTPWELRRGPSSAAPEAARITASGLGTTEFGVKWRFFDDEQSGWSISTYPQLGNNLHGEAADRGLAAPGRSLFLPVEAAGHLGPVDLDLEAGRLLEQPAGDPPGKSAWIGGVILAHEFVQGREALFEVRREAGGTNPSTLLNLGSRWELGSRYSLMGALGHAFGASSPERSTVLVYLGLQIRL